MMGFQIPYLIHWIKSIPNLFHRCPYKAGETYSYNYTFIHPDCPAQNNRKKPHLMHDLVWSDGHYKTYFKFEFSNGKSSAYINYFYEEKTGDNRAW